MDKSITFAVVSSMPMICTICEKHMGKISIRGDLLNLETKTKELANFFRDNSCLFICDTCAPSSTFKKLSGTRFA
jgi:hypothetical protein